VTIVFGSQWGRCEEAGENHIPDAGPVTTALTNEKLLTSGRHRRMPVRAS
jgi:hypothetical protein